jgi:hypothetical protein
MLRQHVSPPRNRAGPTPVGEAADATRMCSGGSAVASAEPTRPRDSASTSEPRAAGCRGRRADQDDAVRLRGKARDPQQTGRPVPCEPAGGKPGSSFSPASTGRQGTAAYRPRARRPRSPRLEGCRSTQWRLADDASGRSAIAGPAAAPAGGRRFSAERIESGVDRRLHQGRACGHARRRHRNHGDLPWRPPRLSSRSRCAVFAHRCGVGYAYPAT